MEPFLAIRRSDQPTQKRRQQGFTLIEMLAVVLILVIVAGIGFVVVNNQIEKSRERTDIANVRTIADAVQRYMLENTTPPSKVVDQNNELIKQGYLAAPPTDPWDKGNTYTIEPSGQDIKIIGVTGYSITLEGAVPSGGGG